MYKKIKNLVFNSNTTFIKVVIMNGFSSIVKIVTSFVTTKIVATIIGPSGIALIGQLSNFLAFIFAFSSGGINGGVVKYTAENRNQTKLLKYYLSTSFRITLFFSTILGVSIILFANYLSKKILYSDDYSIVFYFIGSTIVLYAFNSIFLSIVNGLKDFKKYTIINVVSSLATLVITVLLVFFFKIRGALIGLIISQSSVFLITLYFIKKDYWFKIKMLLWHFKWKIANRFFKYSMMAMVTALLVPTTQFLIRSYVITNFSIDQAGIWEGMNKVSNMYLVVVTTTLGIYFLPKFSETKDDGKLRVEILNAFKIVIPVLILCCFLIYICRVFIIRVVFTANFLPMQDLFMFQLMGDVVKIMTWILGTVMVSKAMLKHYVFFEIFTNVLLYFLSLYFSKSLGLSGFCLGYFVSLFISFILMIFTFRKLLLANEQFFLK
ncbi:O-antigen translocase [Flavobacterium gawalongense]|uniref:O-antigen translocase n=1 Tax=Flavobacterium gawalongense TaxID=2594432 RepID=A0ABY3CQ38_9FLAO|nr:O-antigen translocase [Flavobacterium gawalongense]TRX04453.1 O-antigen translocase [Flavobacterium gawalongense]TRX10342.1 O-antigen translocase [Flavobacterium gawalongense]